MTIKEILTNLVKEALEKINISADSIPLDHPVEISHGDYATNVAFALAKAAKSNPVALAESIAAEIPKHDMIESVTAAAGFINFHLAPKFFQSEIGKILAQTTDFGNSQIHAGKKILVEHSSPNLFKPFHVGHVMNNAIGESVARLAQASGARVTKMSYPSDVSLGIGKSVWALLEEGVDKLENMTELGGKLKFLGECYVQGTKAYDENPSIMRRVKEITEMIYEKTPGVEYDAYLLGKEISLGYFLDITKRLGSKFDDFIYESEAGEIGKKLVLENLGKIFEESENAVVYKGEKDGLHTRVFINAEGYPTYEAKDIGLLWMKFERNNPDISILVTDNHQASTFEVVLKSSEHINPVWSEKTIHKTHGRMSFKGKKMSSRLGGVPTAVEVLDTVLEEVAERSKEGIGDADAVAIGALKFTILKTMAGKDINFDPETSLSFEGDSGPYLQYTNARINSILEKAKAVDLTPNAEKGSDELPTEVEKLVFRFPEIVELSITEWAPHHITTYLLQLARAFNSWYGNTKLVDAENPNTKYNLAIAKSIGIVIQNGLQLLGIKSPERM
jgi:arginyl-tRNA synthetase